MMNWQNEVCYYKIEQENYFKKISYQKIQVSSILELGTLTDPKESKKTKPHTMSYNWNDESRIWYEHSIKGARICLIIDWLQRQCVQLHMK